MRYMLDTCTFLYLANDHDLLDHRDPSDHIIISHAMTLKMPLISSDTKFGFYAKQGLDLIINKK